MNKNLLNAVSILTHAGIIPGNMPPLPIHGEKLHKYHHVTLRVETIFGVQIVFGDVVSHLSLGDWCKLNKAKVMTPPSFYSEAKPGEQTDLALGSQDDLRQLSSCRECETRKAIHRYRDSSIAEW